MRRSITVWTGLVAMFFMGVAACSDDVASSDEDCPTGEEYNPILEVCEPVDDTGTTDDAGGFDTDDQDDDGDGSDGDGDDSDDNDDSSDDDNDPTDPGPDDGTPPYDPYDEASQDDDYHSCESEDFEGLDEPGFIYNEGANYLVAVDSSADISGVDSTNVSLDAHLLADGDGGYNGFVSSFEPPTGDESAEDAADLIFERVDGIDDYGVTRKTEGQPYMTHDAFSASVLHRLEIDTDDGPDEVRDRILGRIYGQSAGDLEHLLDETVDGDGSALQFVYKTVARGDEQVIAVGGITTTDRWETPDSGARFAVQDLAGGTSLAGAGETMSEECVSMELKDTDEVDIIVSLDASGSMGDVNENLKDFTDELVEVLDDAGVDWRVAVTGVDCHEIRDDDDLSPEYRSLWPDPDDWESDGPDFPIGDFDDFDTPCEEPVDNPFEDGGNNGRLMEGTFTTDADEIEDRMDMVSGTGLEYTLTMGIAALDHALPRAEDDPAKLRTHAAPVVIGVTDENEQLFKDAYSDWISGGNDPLTSDEQSTLEEFIQPWLNFINRPDLNATISGLYWVPGTECEGGVDVAHGIHHVVEETDGAYDSICAPDITDAFADIADATQQLETGLHLVGSPFSGSVAVDVEDPGGTVEPMDRSIADGFDFDTTTNSLHFEGASEPEEGDRIIVPYLQWDDNATPCSDAYPCPGDKECLKGTCQ